MTISPWRWYSTSPYMLHPPQQHMLLHMQKYDFTIQFKPGKEIILPDHLSHFPSCKETLPIEIHCNIQHLQLSTDKINIIWGGVKYDPVYNTLYWLTLNEWLKWVNYVLQIAWHFWGAWDKLAIEDSILLRGDWVCISPSCLTGSLLTSTEPYKV